ncbi:glycosyltransferase family 2 protein [Marinobacter sp. MMG032]|uniref:Glycosyltransferase family 2 protein n=1 Tax=Marinobacter sp. MMG032 TaxID=3158548 RepID=A0AAU7MLH8_9GAMM
MNRAPIVSVVMPVYNAEATVAQAVESVLLQEMADLELIVCDDASTDSSIRVLEKFKDPRIKLIKNTKNMGPGHSRDKAIGLASGVWIGLIDADDAWAPERLKRMLASVNEDNHQLIFDDILICHSTAGRLVPWRRLHGRRAFGGVAGATGYDVPLENYIVSPRLLIKPLIRRTTISEVGVQHSDRFFAEDAEFFLRLAWSGISFRYLPEPLYLYRVQPGSATAHAGLRSMRECIQSCSEWGGWSAKTQLAFQQKIKALRHNESLYQIAWHLRSGRLLGAFKQIVADPGVLATIPHRALKHLSYQLHRLLHGGASRNSGEV